MAGLVGFYHPVFDELKSAMKDIEVPPKQCLTAWEFSGNAVKTYNTKEDRQEVQKNLLNRLLGETIRNFGTKKCAQSDGTIVTNTNRLFNCAIFEWKNEIGTGKCDPSIQGALSYRNYRAQDAVRHNHSTLISLSF